MQKIEAKDLFNINFYKMQPFFGSFRGMNYRIIKYAPEQSSDAQSDSNDSVVKECLRVTTWKGPYIYDVTPDEEKTSADFPFSNEGLEQITDYLNRFWEDHYQSDSDHSA